MARNSGSRPALAVVTLSAWVVAVALAQGLLGSDLGASVQRAGDAIELLLRGEGAAPKAPAPARTQEPDTLDPWDLVGV